MPTGPHRVKVEIPRSLHAELRDRAGREGVPMTNILLEWVRDGRRIETMQLEAIRAGQHGDAAMPV